MTERVAIVGSRAHPNLGMVRDYVLALPPGVRIVSGGAAGVDSAAEEAAVERVRRGVCRRMPDVFEPRWPTVHWSEIIGDLSTRDRLLYRNTLIVLACTRLVCFPDGSKGGCRDAVREAKRLRRPVEIRWCDGRIEAGEVSR